MGFSTRQVIKGKSIRRKNWDYSSNACYHVTINTHLAIDFFGEVKGPVEDARVELSQIGSKVKEFWEEIPAHYKQAVLDEFVVMPNHFHAIIFIKNPEDSSAIANQPAPRKNSLGNVIGSFKSVVSKYASANNIPFSWHRRYHDSIIDSKQRLEIVREYIRNNPKEYLKKKSGKKN
jgi:putative transposase